ncbi:MAG: hypothetical protein U5R06_00100 [candidate division KSB1 bacterium]|nr:hypothetical protein [candidate division KSB1 bacterium]
MFGQMEQFESLENIGQLQFRRSETILASRWGLQFNKYAVPDLEIMLNRIADSGVKWARVQTDGYAVEPEQGYYNWSVLDSVVHGLKKRKIALFITFDQKALGEWENQEKPLNPNLTELWLRYVTKLVSRYQSQVQHWEILNEPKLNANYARLVIRASKTIKEIDPEARILAGSLARMDVEGLKEILERGIGPHTDVITYHPYNEFPESVKYPFYVPVKTPQQYMRSGHSLSDLQTVLSRENQPIELWQGECGYPSSANSSSWQGRGPWGENIQAKWLLRRFLIDLSQDIPVSVCFILREPQEGERINAKGLLHHGTMQAKPAYRALQHLTRLFDQDLNQAHDIQSDIQVIDNGCFYGVRGKYPESFGTPYSKAKAPTPIERFAVSGKGGPAIVYWLPWRMQEIIRPAQIHFKLRTEIDEPVLVDLLTGNIYEIKYEKTNNFIQFLAIPLTDYPLLIIDKKRVIE